MWATGSIFTICRKRLKPGSKASSESLAHSWGMNRESGTLADLSFRICLALSGLQTIMELAHTPRLLPC